MSRGGGRGGGGERGRGRVGGYRGEGEGWSVLEKCWREKSVGEIERKGWGGSESESETDRYVRRSVGFVSLVDR